ncbi:uncharacterized protein LOC144121425 [Amblyomma americanum]
MILVLPAFLLASFLGGSEATFFGPQPVQYVPPVTIYHLVRTNVVPAVTVNATELEPKSPEVPEGDKAEPPPKPGADESSKNVTADEVDAKKLVPALVPVTFVPVRLPFGGVGPVVRPLPYVPGFGSGYGYVPCLNCPRLIPGYGVWPYGVYYK